MNIFLEDTELEEIRPVDPTEDRGIVVNPETGKNKQEISETRKEIAAIDTLSTSTRQAAELHGVGKTNVNRYSNGEGLTEDGRARVLSVRHNIQDLAITKLMDTLNLLNPEAVEKERDKVGIMVGLSQVIEKLNPAKDNNDRPTVHLHMYAPTQKTEKEYDVIDA